MNEAAKLNDQPSEADREADAAIALCDGDVRAALKAALAANTFLIAEVERLSAFVSRGLTRGSSPTRRASEALDRWRGISLGRFPKTGEPSTKRE